MAKATNRPTIATRAENRPPRVPLTGTVDILEVGNKDPNHEYRWVNDEKGKLQKYDAAWWDKVTEHEVQLALGAKTASTGSDSPVVQKVGTTDEGKPLYAYLMRKPKKYFDEDYALKMAEIDKKEAAMFRGIDGIEKEGQYGGVKQSVSRTK